VTDAEIIRAVVAGDRRQFGELLRRYQGMVYGLAWHLLGSHSEAQDAAQEAFIAAYIRLPVLLQPEKFPAWLRRITVNQCRMRQRRRKEAVSWEEIRMETLSNADTPAMLAERAELRRQVHKAIACLPESQRLAVTLFYLSGMSCEEAGRFLGVGANAVKGRLHRARMQLKAALMDSMEEVMNEQKPGEEFTAAALREIETYEEQARFHQGAIHQIGQLVPGAKANVAVIVRCAYLASKFGYHTQPLIEVARLAAQCDQERPELASIAELAVLTLSSTDHVVPLAQEAAKAQTGEERSHVQQTIEQMRARAGCANIQEALERQSRLHQSGANLDAGY
jgi:RNA polymerase sigma-70 factor (ECF subfamily)